MDQFQSPSENGLIVDKQVIFLCCALFFLLIGRFEGR